MSVKKVEAILDGISEGQEHYVLEIEGGSGIYAVLPWADWVEVLAWAEDDQGLPHDLRERLGIIEGSEK
jgi:hypothetical protein